MTERELALRREIFVSFAETGRPPEAVGDREALRSLAEQHVVVLDDEERIVMAHPFGHPGRVHVSSRGRTWAGNCAWDAFGIVAALGLREATIREGELALEVAGDEVHGDAVFHVLLPARDWWADVGFT